MDLRLSSRTRVLDIDAAVVDVCFRDLLSDTIQGQSQGTWNSAAVSICHCASTALEPTDMPVRAAIPVQGTGINLRERAASSRNPETSRRASLQNKVVLRFRDQKSAVFATSKYLAAYVPRFP